MYYELIVSKNGKHFFATAERSLINELDARQVYQELSARFPKSEGYAVTAMQWRKEGRHMDFES